MLQLQNLGKSYKTGDDALKGVNLEIPDGQIVGLIGPSGAGKSTLIRCVNRLVEPTTGKVILNDVDVTTLSSGGLRKERRKMGMIFQEYALVDRLTIMENVLSGLRIINHLRNNIRRLIQVQGRRVLCCWKGCVFIVCDWKPQDGILGKCVLKGS